MPKAIAKLHPLREKRKCEGVGETVSKMLCLSSDTVARGASPARVKCLHFDHSLNAQAPVSLVQCVREGRLDVHRFILKLIRFSCDEREKKIENFLCIVWNFQTRVDRWVLITALCVVEWNAQHNWLVCINVGGEFSRTFAISCSLSKFHNFRLELDIVKIACLGDIWNSKSLFKCNQTWQPRVSTSLSGVSRHSFISIFQLIYWLFIYWLILQFSFYFFFSFFFCEISCSNLSRDNLQLFTDHELLTIVSETEVW